LHKNILVIHLYKYTIVSKNKFILDIRSFSDSLIEFFGLNATKDNSYSPEGTFTKEFISKDTFKHPPLYPLPSPHSGGFAEAKREGRFLSPLSLEGRGQG
jgi:hypothetical protein